MTLMISSSWHLLVGGIYSAASEHFVLKVDVLEAGKMDKRKDLSEFDKKGQIVMARPLDQSISKTAALVGCSRSAVVSIYQKYPLRPVFQPFLVRKRGQSILEDPFITRDALILPQKNLFTKGSDLFGAAVFPTRILRIRSVVLEFLKWK
ncbi:hypothetical protein QTP86_001495 [Hemibagrus guttatus]|nr:hypothetical protein QTP86_001495 [Hemibagrus guttatus]